MNRGQDRVLLRRLGQQLRRRRLFLGRSQSQVAERAGVSQSSISRMERGMAGGAPFRTWTAVADIVGLSIELGSSIDPDLPGARATAGSLVDGRLAGLELVARLAEAGNWAARSRVVEDPSGTLRAVNLTLRRYPPPQAVVVRIWDTVVNVEALMDDLEQELEVARRSTDAAEISGLIVVRATSSNRRQITQWVSASDSRFQESGSRWIGVLRDPRPARLPRPTAIWFDRAATRLIPGGLVLQRPRQWAG
jgi:transcriptional regulator with XRE-family HTH domain